MPAAGDAFSTVLNDLRERAISYPPKSFGFYEYSAPQYCKIDDRNAWAMANPSLGYTITEDQLVTALRKLIAQTRDLQSSQVLLSKALDISAGSGADLDSVLNAINKAAIGNYTSIGKLGVGFTAAEAKSMGFVKLMQSLDKYTGAAEDQTKTFAGQLKSFQISNYVRCWC